MADAGSFGRDSDSQSGQFAFAFVTCCLWWLPTAILGHCHGKWSEGYEGPFTFCWGEVGELMAQPDGTLGFLHYVPHPQAGPVFTTKHLCGWSRCARRTRAGTNAKSSCWTSSMTHSTMAAGSTSPLMVRIYISWDWSRKMASEAYSGGNASTKRSPNKP